MTWSYTTTLRQASQHINTPVTRLIAHSSAKRNKSWWRSVESRTCQLLMTRSLQPRFRLLLTKVMGELRLVLTTVTRTSQSWSKVLEALWRMSVLQLPARLWRDRWRSTPSSRSRLVRTTTRMSFRMQISKRQAVRVNSTRPQVGWTRISTTTTWHRSTSSVAWWAYRS